MKLIPGRTFIAQGLVIRTGDIPIAVSVLLSITSYLLLTIVSDPDVVFYILLGLTLFAVWLAIKLEQLIGIR